MKNATKDLLRLMVIDAECEEFIKNGWNTLYNDINACIGKDNMDFHLSQLDEVSRYALLDWYEHNDPIAKYFEEEMNQ